MATICVPVRVPRPEQLIGAIEIAARTGTFVEVRADYLSLPEGALPILRDLPDELQSRIIITLRSPQQGGQLPHSADVRRAFWSRASQLPNVLFDVELDLLQKQSELAFDLSRVICSHHDFTGVPEDLVEIYERMAATQAGRLKLAIQANDATDCLPVFKLLERAPQDGRELTAIAMGHRGLMTRVLGPSRGSFLTYGALDDASATAPGQITAQDLRNLYRVDSIDCATQITGLVGNPVGHSLSPHIHNAAYAEAKANAIFIPIEVDEVTAFLRTMVRPGSREIEWNLRGLSVTAPHKSTVIGELNWIDAAAREIGAVNTIVVEGEELHGYNTDAIGFITPLKRRQQSLADLRCAVIGAGGSARAVVWALKAEGAIVTVFARDEAKGKMLAQQFGVACKPISNATFRDFDVVINATPVGTRGMAEHETPATREQLGEVRLAYDLVYNPFETRFLSEARAAGCDTIGGLEMLIAQAVEQFKLWTGKQPNVDVMRAAAERRLGIE
jgi:shikimate dehydrogenase/3-dehydroquinate dehydratase type I